MRKHCKRVHRREAAPTMVAYYLNPEVSIQERMAVDEATLAICEVGLVALENIKARYLEKGRIGATGDELQALQALVDVSEDFWKRQGGGMFIEAEAALSKVRAADRDRRAA